MVGQLLPVKKRDDMLQRSIIGGLLLIVAEAQRHAVACLLPDGVIQEQRDVRCVNRPRLGKAEFLPHEIVAAAVPHTEESVLMRLIEFLPFFQADGISTAARAACPFLISGQRGGVSPA